ncbi:hypothetical protein TNCV_4964721 [Trichonephila clavipes]|nr:hypothetical protein TNCV_4964721 [Trichonephila clavipes]
MTIVFVCGDPVVNALILPQLYSDTPLPQLVRCCSRTCSTGDKSEERAGHEESENDVGSLEQLLLYVDEHYLAGKLPPGRPFKKGPTWGRSIST